MGLETLGYIGLRTANLEDWTAYASRFLGMQLVDSPRGIGLMQAMELDRDLGPQLEAAALEHGLLVNAIGPRTIRLVPPLIIGKAEVDRAVAVLAQCLDLLLSHAPSPGGAAP